jgi:hypothetical protein
MYIEDLILRTAGHGQWIWDQPITLSTAFESNFIQSVANQVDTGESLTEKQASLAIKILAKVEPELINHFKTKTWDLNNPNFKRPFRSLSSELTVTIDRSSVPGRIVVRFPFIESVIKDIKDFKLHKRHNTAEWSPDQKAWIFSLREDCIQFIQNTLVPKGFKVDEEFIEYVKQIENIEKNLEQHIPMVTLDQEKPKFINVFDNVPQPYGNDITHSLFLARQYGITTYSDEISDYIENKITNTVTKSIIKADLGIDGIWIDSKIISITDFNDIVDYDQPLLIVVPGGSEYKNLKDWHEFLLSRGINSKDISVMFRLPNEGKGDFNIYVKENQLNNEITASTKVVFVSVKIPKPLVKTNIKFNAIINLGYHLNTHYTMDTLLRSSPTLIFYTDTKPTQKRYGYR